MRIVCECLNIKVEVDSFLDLKILKLNLTPEEKQHLYFSKNVYKVTGKVSGISETHSRLCKNEIIGSWNICQCLICQVFTHGTNYVTGLATCSSSLNEEPADFKIFGRSKNSSYSQVFQVCFPSHLEVPEDFLPCLSKCDIVGEDSIENISKQANSFLEMAEKKMKMSTKSPVEKQIQMMETLRRRVKCEEKYLHFLILQSKNEFMQERVASNVTESNRLEFASPNPSSTEYRSTNPDFTGTKPCSETALRNPDCDPTSMLMSQNVDEQMESSNLHGVFQMLRMGPYQHSELKESDEPRSPDAEGIFEMDDIAPISSSTFFAHQELEERQYSEEEEEEEEEEEDNDEMTASYSKFRGNQIFAKSVPLDVPLWPNAISRQDRGIDAKRPKDPQEIAASMRELARSVRISSADVFGELPRPNFTSNADFAP